MHRIIHRNKLPITTPLSSNSLVYYFVIIGKMIDVVSDIILCKYTVQNMDLNVYELNCGDFRAE